MLLISSKLRSRKLRKWCLTSSSATRNTKYIWHIDLHERSSTNKCCCNHRFTDNFKRFSFNSRKICTYWGVTPFRNESGDSIRRGTHTSSFHNNWLKAILSEAVLCAIRYNERLKTYFLRLLAKGKHRNIALNNTKNKLLKTLVAMVRDSKTYDENYVSVPPTCAI